MEHLWSEGYYSIEGYPLRDGMRAAIGGRRYGHWHSPVGDRKEPPLRRHGNRHVSAGSNVTHMFRPPIDPASDFGSRAEERAGRCLLREPLAALAGKRRRSRQSTPASTTQI
jgi:hypothetical protein